MEDTTQPTAIAIDFDALCHHRSLLQFDGHVGVYENPNGNLTAIVTISPGVPLENFSKLDRMLQTSGFVERNPLVRTHYAMRPKKPHFVVLSTLPLKLEAELSLLIEYLYQCGVCKSTIVCDFRWLNK